ncbi:MAG: efflux RND transporter periplasmic adaptor subunit [Motiliproteus sp.]
MNSQNQIAALNKQLNEAVPAESLSDTPLTRRVGGIKTLCKRALLLALFVALSLLIGDWLYQRSYTVAIDDARIAADIIAISSKVPGRISRFPVTDGQRVNEQSLLTQIDARSAALELQTYRLKIAAKQAGIEKAEAQLKMTAENSAGHVRSQQAQLRSSLAGLAKAKSELTLAQSNFKRSTSLKQKQLISEQGWEQQRLTLEISERGYQQAQAELARRESELSNAKSSLRELEIEQKTLTVLQQQLNHLKLERQQQQQRLEDHQVRSPIGGVVDKTFVHAGEYVTPGKRLMMIHDPNAIWISANAKETDLRHIKLGARARVERIDQATTSEFALLPNPNPSGNFTKVTQRVTVRLAIEQQNNLLKPGMMVEVAIDTRG